jgi:CheY-like chemotaxis protein
MNGLELVSTMRTQHADVPVILMTSYGSEDLASLALQRGAASCVPKQNLARDLPETVENVLSVTKGQRKSRQQLDEERRRFEQERQNSLEEMQGQRKRRRGWRGETTVAQVTKVKHGWQGGMAREQLDSPAPGLSRRSKMLSVGAGFIFLVAVATVIAIKLLNWITNK